MIEIHETGGYYQWFYANLNRRQINNNDDDDDFDYADDGNLIIYFFVSKYSCMWEWCDV